MSTHVRPWSVPFLVPPAVIYEALIRTRNGLYSAGILTPKRLARPVISIGNLTLGGSGKSPFVIYLAKCLLNLGAVPAVLSRGYGRQGAETFHVLEPGSGVDLAASLLGDEPALIKRHVPETWLGICVDRYVVGQKILAKYMRPIFILDDGFQHRRLYRDLDIVVIDRTQPFSGNRVFPWGTLREPLVGLRRAHIVIIVGGGEGNEHDPVESMIEKTHPTAKIFHAMQRIDSLVPFQQWSDSGASSQGVQKFNSAFLVAALGNPERFRKDIQAFGISVSGSRFYRDHRRLDLHDWKTCLQHARRAGAEVLITTEKDAIKLPGPVDLPLLVSVQSTRVSEAESFGNLLKTLVEEAR